jgi:putative acetyltransferase
MLELKRTNNSNTDFLYLVPLLDKDLRERYHDLQNEYDQHNVIINVDTVVIAYSDGQPAGCGCFKQFNPSTVEMKRMYVKPEFRRQGISSSVLTELEKWATELGYRDSVLETGDKQEEALGMYKKLGYVIIPNFPPYEEMSTSICLHKSLNG